MKHHCSPTHYGRGGNAASSGSCVLGYPNVRPRETNSTYNPHGAGDNAYMINSASRLPRFGLMLTVLVLLTLGLPQLASAQDELLLRPSASLVLEAPAIVLDTFQYDTSFVQQSTAGTSAPDLEEVLLGTRSTRLSTDGDGVQANLRAEGLAPLDLTTSFLRLRFKIDKVDELDRLLLYLSSDGFENYEGYRLLRGDYESAEIYAEDGSWATITVPLGTPQFAEAAGADLSRITDIQLSVADRGNGPVTAWFASLEAVTAPAQGIVSIVFDDARSGAYQLAVPIAYELGVRASVAVISDLVGVQGFMTLEELKRVERFAGWDVIAHHKTELPDGGLDTLSASDMRTELAGIKRWMIENNFHRGADFIAYPYGGFNDASIEEVRRYFAAGRTIMRANGLETYPPADPYRIRALSVSSSDDPATVNAAIDRAARERSWLVLVFHQFTNQPAGYDTEYSSFDFAEVLAHLVAADVTVKTLPEVLLGR